MQFYLVDKIESIEPGKRIVTTKALSLAEEYLADHFPTYPVMPGVLMIEAMVQAAAWLVRVQQDFANSIIVLSSVRNVRYGRFVHPGEVLRCELEAMAITDGSARFKGAGFVGQNQAVSGRLELNCFNLSGRQEHLAQADAAIIQQMKEQFKLIGGPSALASAAAGQSKLTT